MVPSQDLVNVYDHVEQLCSQKADQELLERIEKQFSGGQIPTYTLLLTGRGGKVAVFAPGRLEGEGSCYAFHQTTEFTVKLNEDDAAFQSTVTAVDLSLQCQQIVFATQSGHYAMHSLADYSFMHAVSCSAYPLTSVQVFSPTQVAVGSTYEK